MKKIPKSFIISIIIIAIIVFILLSLLISKRDEKELLNMNWNISLPMANKIDVIYNYEGREGEDLEIWHYSETNSATIINNTNFKSINEYDIEFIQEKLKEYYGLLSKEYKVLFDDNVNVKKLLIQENYFLYKEKDDSSWLLLLLDTASSRLYYISDIY